MKILSIVTAVVFLSTSALAQFERTLPVVSIHHPLNFQHKAVALPDFSSLANNPLAIDGSLPFRLQHAMDSLYAKTTLYGKHGVAAAIIVPGLPMWTGSVGESHPDVPLTPQHLFEIASNTKTFTTALIMQLAEEGHLSLSDSLWEWLPPYENIDSTITIRQLLEHSSGIYDYLNDDPLGTVLIDAYFYTPDKVWTSEEILSQYIGAPNFAPGTSYRYSNSNFLLLGLIAEKASGAEYTAEIRRRFLHPLGLTNTFCAWKEPIIGEFAHNWFDTTAFEPMMDLGLIDKTAQLSMAGPAGGMASIPGDLVQWVKALYQDRLLADSSKTQMIKLKTWPDGSRYGLGTARVPFGTKSFYGHTGGLLGFYSSMFNNPKDSVSIVLYSNSGYFDGDVSGNDYTIALLTEIYRPASSVSNSGASMVSASVSPNPVAQTLTMHFTLRSQDNIAVALHDMLGNTVMRIAEGVYAGGDHKVSVDVAKLPSGIYTYRMQSADRTLTGKVIVAR